MVISRVVTLWVDESWKIVQSKSVLNTVGIIVMSHYLVHRRIVLKPHHIPTGKTRHTVGSRCNDRNLIRGPEMPAPHELVVAQLPSDEGYYLLYLDKSGKEITDTYHDSLDNALAQAKWEFNVEFDEWQKS